jgi:hypothetical protein
VFHYIVCKIINECSSGRQFRSHLQDTLSTGRTTKSGIKRKFGIQSLGRDKDSSVMGCKASKPSLKENSLETATIKASNVMSSKGSSAMKSMNTAFDDVYNLLIKAKNREDPLVDFWPQVKSLIDSDSRRATYVHPTTKRTPLHIACSMVDLDDGVMTSLSDEMILSSYDPCSVVTVIFTLIDTAPESISAKDSKGNIPLHYVLSRRGLENTLRLKVRAQVLAVLTRAKPEVSQAYFLDPATVFDTTETGRVSPFYHILQTLPNDFNSDGITVNYISSITSIIPCLTGISNASDGDQPLALLYRRFTRQFDASEKFFPGDNSIPEVVEHRRKYKMAAGNTWKIIETLLRPPVTADSPIVNNDSWRVVHRAIQVETPPDLLRYIIETNAEDLTQPDEYGNLPLHYAAKSIPQQSAFPAFYSKYVIDELLYKFPEAASIPDASGYYPLTLAVHTGKQWIGGGVKSLYDAYPEALGQIDLDAHASLRKALSFGADEKEANDATLELDEGEEALTSKGVVRDEHHDAIMLVQQENIPIFEIVAVMWAHEEDGGVQMLSCVALSRHIDSTKSDLERIRIALSTIAAVVNAMKAHPNEPVVQEKACSVLKKLACADGYREISFVASGSIAAIVGAMQAHIVDASVQEEACASIAEIVRRGGEERATVVASVSGITAVINSLTAHPSHEGVQVEACRALKFITDFPEAHVPDLPRAQMESLLEIAKKTSPACTENAEVLFNRLS